MEVLLPIIAKYGIEGMLEIIALIKNKDNPTHEEWTALHVKYGNKKAEEYLAEAQARINGFVPPPAPPRT